MSTLRIAAVALALWAAAACAGTETAPASSHSAIRRIAICCVPERYLGLNVGAELPLYAFAFDSAGDTLGVHPAAAWWPGSATSAQFSVSWWSSDSSIASVDALGVVTAHKVGMTFIHARAVQLGDTLVDSVPLPTVDVHAATKSPPAP